jgi:hypothetical protein
MPLKETRFPRQGRDALAFELDGTNQPINRPIAHAHVVIGDDGKPLGTPDNPLVVNDIGASPVVSELVSRDVWGRSLSVGLKSLLSVLWSYGNLARRGRVTETGTGTVASVDGALQLSVSAASDEATWRSRRHPTYQSNRGHVFSTASVGIVTDPNARLRIGLFGPDCGCFFEIIGDTIFAVRRNVAGNTPPSPEDWTSGGGTVADERVDITATVEAVIPGFDIGQNHLWDLRFQWRGAGNIQFFIDQKLVHTFERLGIETGISIAVPGQPARFELEATGTPAAPVTARFGCVAVDSEGGDTPAEQAIIAERSEAAAAISTETPWIAIKVAPFVHGLAHTRDLRAKTLQALADNETIVRVYRGDGSDLTGGTWAASAQDPGVLIREPTGATLASFTLETIGSTGDSDTDPPNIPINLTALDPFTPDEGGTIAADADSGDVLLVTIEAVAGTANDIWTALACGLEV